MSDVVKAWIAALILDRLPPKLRKKVILYLLKNLNIGLSVEELKELEDYIELPLIPIPQPLPPPTADVHVHLPLEGSEATLPLKGKVIEDAVVTSEEARITMKDGTVLTIAIHEGGLMAKINKVAK